MQNTFQITKGSTYPLGVSKRGSDINIAIAFDHKPVSSCGILFYHSNGKTIKIEFEEAYKVGLLYAISIHGLDKGYDFYQFYVDDEYFVDPYAKMINGRQKWGNTEAVKAQIKGQLVDAGSDLFDWEGDAPLGYTYEESILYSLHMRGFTKHTSSKVKNKGTFEGLTEKIPYLKELGITGIVTMPIYEFDEIIVNETYEKMNPQISEFLKDDETVWKYRINYWGFRDDGNYYMAPKCSYSKSQRADIELKQMIKMLHKSGIEVLMQIYFPVDCRPDYIQTVLRYWVEEYHIDGFMLLGMAIPNKLLALDPILGKTKLIMEHTDIEQIYPNGENNGYFKNIGLYSDDFRADARKFIKGDEDMLYYISKHMHNHHDSQGIVHHITDYRGFTLKDLVSYDRKHNEDNGEDNRDGSDYNYSWNCGAEGVSRKQAIQKLRLSQRKNAMSLLLFAQATPLILAGDEIGRTQNGNNNAYCQDNACNWVNWKADKYDKELFDFVKACIAFRKSHSILHSEKAMRMMDYKSCGYPDLSFHSELAWVTKFENYNRHFGMMYCGLYEDGQKDSEFIYLAYNMHWISHTFALPKLPANYQWKMVMSSKAEQNLDLSTASKNEDTEPVKENEQIKQVELLARSMAFFVAGPVKAE